MVSLHLRNNHSSRLKSTALAEPKITFAAANLRPKNWHHSLPFQQFQALLTLFPKSFSSFLHSTCLLSVSVRYLALDGDYRPFCAACPSYATLRSHTVCAASLPSGRGSHPLRRLFPKRLTRQPTLVIALKTTIPNQGSDLQVELFPVQSPLLGESYSFSFPPLNYMLKFRG